jgi:DNA-binding HxlR family transcriptional regulator
MKAIVSECPLEEALLLLSGRWRVLILYWLSQGPMRFNQLQRANEGISHRMLSLELKTLEEAGLVSRTIHPSKPPQVEYALTEHGQSLIPILATLGDWWEHARRDLPRTRAAA